MLNQFPNPYQQYPQVYPQKPQTNGIIWVQGIEGAKAYQLQPNSNTILMDSENDGKFYIKVSDNVGMCTLRTFTYTEVSPEQAHVDLSNYVTKQELEEVIRGIKNEHPVSTNAKSSSAKQSS